MINQEELAIRKRRGHNVHLHAGDKWSQCKACRMWLTEATVVEERDEEPAREQLSNLSSTSPRVGPKDQEELAICHRRGHNVYAFEHRWSQCDLCGRWLRSVKSVEECEAPRRGDREDYWKRVNRMYIYAMIAFCTVYAVIILIVFHGSAAKQ